MRRAALIVGGVVAASGLLAWRLGVELMRMGESYDESVFDVQWPR